MIHSGIGRAAALLLSQQGATIAVNDLDKNKAQEVVDEIRQLGRETECFPGNVLDEAFPQRLIDDVLRKWGRINGLINNAGIYMFLPLCLGCRLILFICN